MSQERGRILMRSKNTLLILLGGFLTAGALLLYLTNKLMNCVGCSGASEE